MCGETEQSRMSCSEYLSFGAAHPKLQKLNRGGTWPHLGQLAISPKTLNLEVILQGTRTNDKDSLSWSYCSYQQTVPLLPPLSPFSTFLILAYQFWESLDILPLNSFSLLLATSSWYNQVDRQKWKNRPWKISFYYWKSILPFQRTYFCYWIFYGLHVCAPWIPPNSLGWNWHSTGWY